MGRRPTVIKAGMPLGGPRAGLRSFDLDDMLAEAQDATERARREAEQLVQRAQAEAETIREQARQEGYQAGREAGWRDGQEAGRAEALEQASQEFAAQQESLIASCKQAIADIDEARAAWLAAARKDLIELAIAIARRVVRHVGQRDRDVVLANLEEAIRLAGSRTEVTILINPADAVTARQFAASLLEARSGWSHVELTEDESVSPGGCRIQWDTGSVDARLETQLDRIEAELSGGGSADDEDNESAGA